MPYRISPVVGFHPCFFTFVYMILIESTNFSFYASKKLTVTPTVFTIAIFRMLSIILKMCAFTSAAIVLAMPSSLQVILIIVYTHSYFVNHNWKHVITCFYASIPPMQYLHLEINMHFLPPIQWRIFSEAFKQSKELAALLNLYFIT